MRRIAVLLAVLLIAPAVIAQRTAVDRSSSELPPAGTPSKLLKFQHDEIKKLSGQLVELATDIEAEIEKSGENVLPLNTLKKLDEIEKLARKIRGRLKQ